MILFFFSSRRRHTRCSRDWSSDVCSSDLLLRARQHGGPRTTQQPTLIRLGHEPEEPRSLAQAQRPRQALEARAVVAPSGDFEDQVGTRDRKSTRLNSSHGYISYAVFCLKKKNKTQLTHDA